MITTTPRRYNGGDTSGPYVDDSVVLMKSKDIKLVHKPIRHFNENLGLTAYTTENLLHHFLHLELRNDGILFIKNNTR